MTATATADDRSPTAARDSITVPDRRRHGGADRGQTTIDYAVGIGVFLLVVAFVFAFLPTVFAPFDDDSGRLLVLADRTADHLAEDLLVADPLQPGAVDAACTEGFFELSAPDPEDCRYDQNASDLPAATGVGAPGVRINVTVGNGTAPATIDGTTLAAGDPPPDGRSIAIARRAVVVGDDRYRLSVRMW